MSRYEKILTSYIKNLKDVPVIYTQYSTTLNTGRTSSSSSKLFSSVNEQQIPRAVEGVTYDVRNCFVPREGKKICSIDYAALELRAVAHQLYTLLGYSKLRDILNSGDKPVDPHSILAAKMKGISYYEGFKKDYKEDRDKVKELEFSNSGHNLPVVIRAEGTDTNIGIQVKTGGSGVIGILNDNSGGYTIPTTQDKSLKMDITY